MLGLQTGSLSPPFEGISDPSTSRKLEILFGYSLGYCIFVWILDMHCNLYIDIAKTKKQFNKSVIYKNYGHDRFLLEANSLK